MGHPSTTHDAAAGRTLLEGGSGPAGTRHDASTRQIGQQQSRRWHKELHDHDEPAVRELGDVVLASVATRPLLARPLIWQSEETEPSPTWHALAFTDRFVIKVDLTVTDAGTMKTFASVVRFIEIADVGATSPDVDASVTLRFRGAVMTLPMPGTNVAQPTRDQRAFWDAVSSGQLVGRF